eukprot:506526-Rhodomonas_salina.1
MPSILSPVTQVQVRSSRIGGLRSKGGLGSLSRRAPSAPPGPAATAEPPSPSATAHAPALPTSLWAREREWRAGEPLILAQ